MRMENSIVSFNDGVDGMLTNSESIVSNRECGELRDSEVAILENPAAQALLHFRLPAYLLEIDPHGLDKSVRGMKPVFEHERNIAFLKIADHNEIGIDCIR